MFDSYSYTSSFIAGCGRPDSYASSRYPVCHPPLVCHRACPTTLARHPARHQTPTRYLSKPRPAIQIPPSSSCLPCSACPLIVLVEVARVGEDKVGSSAKVGSSEK